jgi:hypothetical protein
MANARKNKVAKGAEVATEVVEVVENVEVEVSDEVVLEAQSDITEVVETIEPAVVSETEHTCSISGVKAEFDENGVCTNFSRLQNGKLRSICKAEQTKASIAWTTERANYRKDYQRAMQLINQGIPAVVPNAKDWKEGDVIMTQEVTINDVVYPVRPAEEVYAEMKQARADARAKAQAMIDAQNDLLKQARKEARETAKAERMAEQERLKAELTAKREAEREAKNAERAELAEQKRLERLETARVKAEERAKDLAIKAEENKLKAEAKLAERLETARIKAEEKAKAIAEKAEARTQALIAKAIAVHA